MDIILTSDAEKMKRQLKILQDPNATPAERAAALEEIQYYVETIDNANGKFLKIIIHIIFINSICLCRLG